MGIDGDKGGRLTRENRTDPWTVQPSGGSEKSYSRNSKKAAGDRWVNVGETTQSLREVEDFSYRAPTRSISNLVLDDAGEVNGGYSGKLPNVDMDN
jgi:hypothetical protein